MVNRLYFGRTLGSEINVLRHEDVKLAANWASSVQGVKLSNYIHNNQWKILISQNQETEAQLKTIEKEIVQNNFALDDQEDKPCWFKDQAGTYRVKLAYQAPHRSTQSSTKDL